MLGDLLTIAAQQGDDVAEGAALDVALGLGDEESRRGAEIWDELVRIENGMSYDADLLSRAEAFKESYMLRARLEDEPPLAAAWKDSKDALRTPH